MSGFSDHFGKVAGAYADFRPRYPDELFEWLAGQCGGDDLAWDCGCGSGQASVALAQHFVHENRKITDQAVRAITDAFSGDLAELAAACHQLLADSAEAITEEIVDRYFGERHIRV